MFYNLQRYSLTWDSLLLVAVFHWISYDETTDISVAKKLMAGAIFKVSYLCFEKYLWAT